jgi:hypothetical protein
MECWNIGDNGGNTPFKLKKLIQTHQLYPVKLFSISPGPVFHCSIIPIVTCPLVPCNGRRGEAN